MRDIPAKGEFGLYSDARNRADFIRLFDETFGHYQFPNGSSIEFQYNINSNECSNLKAKYPETLASSFLLNYKGRFLEFNEQCSGNNAQRITIKQFYNEISSNFTRNISKQRAVLEEIGFCKKFLTEDQSIYWEEKFQHFNKAICKSEYFIYSPLFEYIDVYVKSSETYGLNNYYLSDEEIELKINYLESLKYFREFTIERNELNSTLLYFNFYVIIALMNELNFIERQKPEFNLSNEFVLHLLRETSLLNYLKDKNSDFFKNTFLKKSFCSNCFKIFKKLMYNNKGVIVSKCCKKPRIIDVNQIKRIFIKKINSTEVNFLNIEEIDWRDCILYTIFRDAMKNNEFVKIAKEIKKDDTQIQNATTKKEILNKITLTNENIRSANSRNNNSFQNVN